MIVKISIDGIEYEVSDGETVLNVCKKLGVFVPSLCYLRGFSPTGACGLCVVELNGGKAVLACLTNIKDGMSITTHSNRLNEIRKNNIDKILKHHYINCYNCRKNGTCDLQKLSSQIYSKIETIFPLKSQALPTKSIELANTFLFKPEKCISCQKCVKFLNRYCGTNIEKIETLESIDSSSDISLNASDICPTDALGYKKSTIPEYLCNKFETYDITDIFAPKLEILESRGKVAYVKSVKDDYISDKTRVSLTNLPNRSFDKANYEQVISTLSKKLKYSNHEKCVFIIGDNIDIVSLYYLKKLNEEFENVCLVMNYCEFSNDYPIGLDKLELFSIDCAMFLGKVPDIIRYHIKERSPRIKSMKTLNIENLNNFEIDDSLFEYHNHILFIDSKILNEVKDRLPNYIEKFEKTYGSALKLRLLPNSLSQMLIQDLQNTLSFSQLLQNFNKHDLEFICIIGDLKCELKYKEVYSVSHSVYPIDGAIHLPSKHFIEDELYFLDIFKKITKTTKILNNNLKSNREFLFDIMKETFKDLFEDINTDIHESIRKRFFI